MSTLNIKDPRVARGLTGAFEAYADPNTLLAVEKGTVEGCCISGGIRGLFLAYQNAIHETSDAIRVNLLFSAGTHSLEVANYTPFEGRIDLHLRTAKPILVRCPPWLQPDSVRIEGPATLVHSMEPKTRYLRFSNTYPDSTIVMRFAQPEESRKHLVAGRTYRATWRGDTVLEMDPPGEPDSIFRREAMRATRAPVAQRTTEYRVPAIRW